jgi:anti-sigma factor RsiW
MDVSARCVDSKLARKLITIAALVYQRRQHTINVFVWPASDSGEALTDTRTVRGFQVRHWTHDGMAFWAVSDLNDIELDQFVHALTP